MVLSSGKVRKAEVMRRGSAGRLASSGAPVAAGPRKCAPSGFFPRRTGTGEVGRGHQIFAAWQRISLAAHLRLALE